MKFMFPFFETSGMKTAVLVGVLFCAATSPVWANNLKISNVSLEDRDAGADTAVVEFDISWDNSWRVGEQHDAVWVFLKVRKNSAPAWAHGMLKTAGTDPVDTSPGSHPEVEIVVPTDKTGAFIRRRSDGSGTFQSTNVRLTLDYAASPLSAADSDTIQVKVLGIEMVYIPNGPFYIGDGDGLNESTYALHVTDNTAVQMTRSLVSSVTVDSNANDDIDTTPIGIDGDGGLDTDDNGTIDNASWPVGYNAFYLMKYEVSQGQWRDFLNALTRAQQQNRTQEDVSGDTITNVYVMSDSGSVTTRQGIRAPASGNGTSNPITFGCDLNGNGTFDEDDDGENVAMNYLYWADTAAYCDWSALRPMTETEFEKAARGPSAGLFSEYAWGSSTITQAEGPILFSGRENEAASTSGQGLALYDGPGTDAGGPLRVGFAATASTDRSTAGAGYYGVMELSGSLWETVVTLGNSTGRAFEGSHGDGTLTTTTTYEGNATNTDWPGIDATPARGVTGVTGSGARGGAVDETSTSVLSVSDRTSASNPPSARDLGTGARCVRTE